MCLHGWPRNSKSGQEQRGPPSIARGSPVTVYFPSPDCEGTDQPRPRRTTFDRAAISRPRCSRASMSIHLVGIY